MRDEQRMSEFEKAVEKIREIQRVVYETNLASLDEPIGNSEDGFDSYLGDFLFDKRDYIKEFEDREAVNVILALMKECLQPREEAVLLMRYGFKNGHLMTLEEIGGCFGCTRERIRQVEAKAIRKLKARMHRKNLREGDFR